jgi:hypothetical protein
MKTAKELLFVFLFICLFSLHGHAQPLAHLNLANNQIQLQLQGPGRAISLLKSADAVLTGTAKDLYLIELTDAGHNKRTIGSSAAAQVSVKQLQSGKVFQLNFTHFPDTPGQAGLQVTCRIFLPGNNPSSEWTIEVKNATPYSIEKIWYPLTVLARPAEQKETPTFLYPYDWNVQYRSALLLGLYDGTLIPQPHDNIPDGFGWYEEHPGRMAVQLAAFCDAQGGLCLYTRDGVGYPKLMGFKRQSLNLDITPIHLFPKKPGAGVTLEYPVILQPFKGDWSAAADIYKNWSNTQEWTKVPLSANKQVPDWIKAGYPFFFYAHGRPDAAKSARDWQNTLPRPMLPVLKTYEKLLESPLVLMLYGWEKHAAWITPDVFPAYPSDEDIRLLVAGLHENGSRLCLLNSGTRWAVRNPRDSTWSGLAHWQKEGRQASCVGEDGQWTYDSRPWAHNHKLCVAADGTQKMMDGYITGFAGLGIDATQYDQNLGGESYVCYSSEHGHPPGYGRWMYDESKRLLQHFIRESRKTNPDFATSVEEPNEILIPSLSFYNGRPYMYHGWPLLTNMLCVGVPLFSYLYHEYAAGYGGDLGPGVTGPESERIKIGRTVAAGYLVQVGLMSDAYGFKQIQAAVMEGKPPTGSFAALTLLKNATTAGRTYARDWMVLGKMRPCPSYQVSEFFELKKSRVQSFYNDDRIEYIHPESATIKVPVVLAASWLSPGGVPAWVFINMSEKAQDIQIKGTAEVWKKLTLVTLDGASNPALPAAGDDLVIRIPALQTGLVKLE